MLEMDVENNRYDFTRWLRMGKACEEEKEQSKDKDIWNNVFLLSSSHLPLSALG